MHKIYNLIVFQKNNNYNRAWRRTPLNRRVKTDRYLIGYLMILKGICFSNKSEQHPIRSLCLFKRRLYNTMKYANKNTTDYLVRFHNAQKVNEDYNVSLITKDVQ